MTLKEAFGLLLVFIFWFLIFAWSHPGFCWDCGGIPCGGDTDCPSGCECLFPENDDNEHYGRCA